MNDFLNRMQAQREILKIVNDYKWDVEPLNSLTKKSIERWSAKNELSTGSKLVSILYNIADKVFFLANKSQEQITDDYKKLSQDVRSLTIEIKIELASYKK
ncbi:hypothetical protein MWS75_003680 [Serratia marcescens]|uniref:hypothetical protein n=1 Tax=Serratia TaxID=613 RepID=UPI001F05B91A|nr:hypothetical protein [Serratia marcescens]EIJ7464267.1 hypothetical protein [Serratia marcescens]EJA2551604.1 hypothetical protein [Serratia marcescens]UMK42311.1 hypothetical protein L2D48_19345 [Serratia marcescens]